jgi:hypothetical protein
MLRDKHPFEKFPELADGVQGIEKLFPWARSYTPLWLMKRRWLNEFLEYAERVGWI